MILHTTTSGTSFVKLVSSKFPNSFYLHQNYPNPFNSSTIIKFEIREKGLYSFEIFDMLGRKVDEVFNEIKAPGIYQINYNGEYLNSGVYFYRLYSPKNSITKKFIMVK